MKNLSIEKEIFIEAKPSTVFEALTNSEKIIQYLPLKEVISDWKVGSEVLYKGELEGVPFTDFGTIDILEPNEKFQYTYWSTNHGTERLPANHLTICYSISNSENGTLLKVEHTNFKSEEMHTVMLNLWDFLLGSLKGFVEKS